MSAGWRARSAGVRALELGQAAHLLQDAPSARLHVVAADLLSRETRALEQRHRNPVARELPREHAARRAAPGNDHVRSLRRHAARNSMPA